MTMTLPWRFQPSTKPPDQQTEPALWFAFQESKLLVQHGSIGLQIPAGLSLANMGFTAVREQYLGQLDGQDCYAAELPPTAVLPLPYMTQSLRHLFGQLPDHLLQLAGRAIQIMAWARDHQFCGRCATPTQLNGDRSKICPACGLTAYPRLSPAVIMRVTRDDQILLAHAVRHPQNLFSVLAGFAEPGETLEEAVQREVWEEVGLLVKNIHYFGSQPWPFPHSLMIGFCCEYASGEITFRDKEIGVADWFTATAVQNGAVVTPPASISIAGQLIEAFVQNHST